LQEVRFLKEYLDRGSLGKVVAASCTNHGTVPPGWFQKKELSGGGWQEKALAVALSAYRSLEKGDTVYVDYG